MSELDNAIIGCSIAICLAASKQAFRRETNLIILKGAESISYYNWSFCESYNWASHLVYKIITEQFSSELEKYKNEN